MRQNLKKERIKSMKKFNPDDYDLELLLQIVQAKAAQISSGHLTILKFSTEWKVMLDTPNLDTGKGREEVKKLKPFDTLKDALIDLLLREEVKNV